ncbi:DUF1648 domain-containing protein [Alicyclobacillaceae bacterium I2511]|nr:DUF1648 domain-containing protein [Alicyclobacillaceae bacterium I2511]
MGINGILIVLWLLILGFSWWMPSLTEPTLTLGVRIPVDKQSHPVVHAAIRQYRWGIVGMAAVLVAGMAIFSHLLAWPAVAEGGTLGLVGVLTVNYVLARQRIMCAKVDEQWYVGLSQAVVADTDLRMRPPRVPWLWLMPSFVLLVATGLVGLYQYPRMPPQLAIHFGATGQPDAWLTKTPLHAFLPLYIELATSALFWAISIWIARSVQRTDPNRFAVSVAQQRVFRQIMGRAMGVAVTLMDLGLTASCFTSWGLLGHVSNLVLWGPLLGAAVLAGAAVWSGQNGSRLAVRTGDGKQRDGRRNLEKSDNFSSISQGLNPGQDHPVVARDDDRFWRGGLVYFNRQDPAWFVPKRFGIGWTVNFGHPLVWLALLLLIVFISGIPFLLGHGG